MNKNEYEENPYEANVGRIIKGNDWVLTMKFNGELSIEKQNEIARKICQALNFEEKPTKTV